MITINLDLILKILLSVSITILFILFFITLIKKCEAEIIRLNKIIFLISNIGDNIATKIVR